MVGFRIRGEAAALRQLLDRVLVRCDVAGLEERDDEVLLWLKDGSAALPEVAGLDVAVLADVRVDADAWKADDAVVVIDDDFIVRPPWVSPPPGFEGLDLVVPRGMAFGSGEHESTQLALRALRASVSGGSVADIGTGSGVLALCAERLGCAPIAACDVEAESVRAARELLPRAVVVLGGPDELMSHGPFDNVIANMTGEEILGCAPALRALWNGRGALIASGVRPHEQSAVFAALGGEPATVHRGDDFVVGIWAAL